MEAGLRAVLQRLHEQFQQAADAATDGQVTKAAVLFTQAGMNLGMYIGHFRATMGPRYPSSSECAALNQAAQLLNETILAAMTEEIESPPEEEKVLPYGYSPVMDEDES